MTDVYLVIPNNEKYNFLVLGKGNETDCVLCIEEDYQNLGYCSDGISVNVYFHFLVSSCIGPRL